MRPSQVLNNTLDQLIRPEVRLFGRTLPSFQVCGYTGLVLAISLSLGLLAWQGRALWVMLAIILAAIATFFGLAMLTKIITGEEQLIYYHHEIAVLCVTTLLLMALGQPVLPYLDATLLGIGAFLVCGRIGCLMVGCCHGRPHGWGVCYRHDHAAAGFTHYYVGVRLFPIQAIESGWVLCTVLVGVALVVQGSPAGSALAWYIVAYDLGRFCFEFVRGDPERGYLGGFSEAQWTSLLLLLVLMGAELAGALPFHTWHLAVTLGMIAVMGGVALRRRLSTLPRHQLLNPRHVREIALILETLAEQSSAPAASGVTVQVGKTSLGIQISSSVLPNSSGTTALYTLSMQQQELSRVAAELLAAVIRDLRCPSGRIELLSRVPGVFHLLLHQEQSAPSVHSVALGRL